MSPCSKKKHSTKNKRNSTYTESSVNRYNRVVVVQLANTVRMALTSRFPDKKKIETLIDSGRGKKGQPTT